MVGKLRFTFSTNCHTQCFLYKNFSTNVGCFVLFFLRQLGIFSLKNRAKQENVSTPRPSERSLSMLFFPQVDGKMYESMTSAFSLSLFSAGSGRQRNRFHSFTSLAKDKSYLAGIVVRHEVTLQWGVYQTLCLLRITFESSGGSSAPCPACRRQCSRVVPNWLVSTTERAYSIGKFAQCI